MSSPNANVQAIRIIVFTRFPVPGQAKTRLIPALGPQGAADLQRRMTEFTVAQVRRTGIPMQVRFTGGTEDQMQRWLGADVDYHHQGEGDLGVRLKRACTDAFEDGAARVLMVGCDCPDNRSSNMLDAIKLLDTSPCVIGPASDGGYYLMGLGSSRPDLFKYIDWGTKSVFQQTVAKLDDYRLLPVLNDVDDPQDIPPKISVIIPALNEETSIEATVKVVLGGFNTQAIVVNGGSTDRTPEMAQQAGADVVTSVPGRALQMNHGAKQATGEILLFLHADSELPQAWDRHVRQTLKRPGTSLGYFRFGIRDCFAGRRLIEFGTNLRSRCLKRPYGDQGLFLWRSDFDAMKGFPNVPILEDLYLVRQAGRRGRIRCTNTELLTSGRRWVKYGTLRTTLLNQKVLVAAWLGADLFELKEAYRNGRLPFLALLKKKEV